MTKSQIILLQTARRAAGLAHDPDWRLVLKNVAGVASSKDLSNAAFEDVMAFLEERGFEHPAYGANHFTNKVQSRGCRADDRQAYLIEQLAQESHYRLPGLCMRFSDGRTEDPRKLTAAEASQLIEMLKAVKSRLQSRDRQGATPSLFEPQISQMTQIKKTPLPSVKSVQSVVSDPPMTEEEIPF
jgi:hypothetical protein